MFKFKSTKFLAEIKRRREAVSAAVISARIRVPEEHVWWYWHEFGTASRATMGTANAQGYQIVPLNADILSFPTAGERVFTHKVWHPGVYPRAIVRKVINQIVAEAFTDIAEPLAQGKLDLVRQILLERSIVRAKELIAHSMAQELIGTRVDGKLEGRDAASVFTEQAEIVDTSH
jgi:hypothetical protein